VYDLLREMCTLYANFLCALALLDVCFMYGVVCGYVCLLCDLNMVFVYVLHCGDPFMFRSDMMWLTYVHSLAI